MAYYELAFMLGKSVDEVLELEHEEIVNWFEYFDRRPYQWRDDNRAYIIATSMAGGETKPEQMFQSLKQLKEKEAEGENQFGKKFMDMVKGSLRKE